MLKPGEAVALWGISVDTAARSRAFAAELAAGAAGSVRFALLSDPAHRVIDRYGVQDPRYAQLRHAGIPYPSVYVVDRSGRVAWARIEKDYTQRPANSEIRAAIDAVR